MLPLATPITHGFFVCVYVLFVYLLAGLAMLHNNYLLSVMRIVEKSFCTKTKEVDVRFIHFSKEQLKRLYVFIIDKNVKRK